MRALCLVLPLLLSSPAAATVIASHVGANDPTTEGWTFNNFGDMAGTAGPVLGDGDSMLDAWSVDDDGTNSNLSYVIDLTSQAALMATGWDYTVQLRAADLADDNDFGISAQVETGGRAYAMTFGTTAGGDLSVALSGLGSVATIAGGASDYHVFELIDTDADQLVDLRIDGVTVVSSFFGLPSTRALVAFGDTSVTPGRGGQGNYALAVLNAVPEPGVGLLLLAGLPLAAWARRHASRGGLQ